jgi:6-phosphofructokinase
MAQRQFSPIKRVAISTGGGDAPGLNAVIRAAVLSGIKRGWEMYGIRDGFHGILTPEQYPEGGIIRLTRNIVRGITHLGGTIIGTSNRNNPMRYPITLPDGTKEEVDRTDEIVRGFALHRIDALITVGGDGSLAIADVLAKMGCWTFAGLSWMMW